MHHPDLRSFLETLRREGELRVVDAAVSPRLELAEIHRRVVAAGGPALLFANVEGTGFPVATNLFGSRRRIDLAFGPEPARLFRRMAEAAEHLMPPSPGKLWGFRDLARAALRAGSRTVGRAPVLERRIDPVRLGVLPQIQAWPEDGGPFLTLPLVYTEHPETRRGNLGMYRNQIHDERTLGMHIQIQRGGGFHHHAAEQLGRDLPVHLFLGGPPALILAAVAPLPENVPELVFASLLAGERIPIARIASAGALPIAAEADFLLAGRIPCGRRRLEGPFGDHYGYYARAHEFPIMEVDRLFHRRDAVFPATVVGRPRQEDHWIGEYLQEIFAPIFPLVLNGVLDVWAYDDAGVHPLAAAVVRERYPREAFMAALRILGEGQLSLTKFLLATDARLELRDFRRVLVHVLERADFATDLFVFSNVAQDTLDYTGPSLNRGSKAILLGLGERRHALRDTPAAELGDPRFRRQRLFAPGVLVVEGPPWREGDGEVVGALAADPAAAPFRLVCLVDDAAEAAADEASFLWTVFTRMEPAADIHARRAELRRFHVALDAPLVFDCRIKPGLPPLTLPDPETVARVDARWQEIFPTGLR